MKLLTITGANEKFFFHLLILLESFRVFAKPEDKLYVCDFGLNPAQRQYFENRGILLPAPIDPARVPHPWYLKASLVDYVKDFDYDAVFWIDADCMIVGDVFGAITNIMEKYPQAELYACANGTLQEWIDHVAEKDDPGSPGIGPFISALERLKANLALPYLNSGLFVVRAGSFLSDWKELSYRIEIHVLFEQNTFNLLAYLGSTAILDAGKFNRLGKSLTACRFDDHRVLTPDDQQVYIIHATSPTDEVVPRTRTLILGEHVVTGIYREFSNPDLKGIQSGFLQSYLARESERLISSHVFLPAD